MCLQNADAQIVLYWCVTGWCGHLQEQEMVYYLTRWQITQFCFS